MTSACAWRVGAGAAGIGIAICIHLGMERKIGVSIGIGVATGTGNRYSLGHRIRQCEAVVDDAPDHFERQVGQRLRCRRWY